METTQKIIRFAYISQGKQSMMYTLWTDHMNGSPYVKPRYIKNLSTDKETALMLGQQYAERCGIDFYDESMDELRKIVRVNKWTDTMVRFGKNYGKELRDCEPKFIHWIAKGSPLLVQDEGEGYWSNHYFGGEAFCAIAQTIAVELGLGVMDNRLVGSYRNGVCIQEPMYVSQEQYDKTTERLKQFSSENNDHHFVNGERKEFTLTCLNITGYSSDFGYVNVIKFQDADARIFTYKGTSDICVEKGESIILTATIKHSEYKGQKSTYLQRIKIK